MDKYRTEIDGLRGLAVTFVVAHHLGFGLSGGFVGVDVFFVISGYLITGQLIRDIDGKQFALHKFWWRRVRRIAPALLVVVLTTLFASAFLLFPEDQVQVAKSALLQPVALSNVYFWLTGGYFDASSDLKPLLHTWSLAVEEQFYVAFPFVMILSSWCGRHGRTVTIGLLAIASLIISEYGAQFHANAAYYLLPTRAWELLLGGLVANLPPLSLRSTTVELAGWIGLLSMVGSAGYLSGYFAFPGINAIIPCLGTCLCLVGSDNSQSSWKRVLSLSAIRYVGTISYSLYLWHWPIIVFWKYIVGDVLPIHHKFLVLLLSILLSSASWRFIEQPFRSGDLAKYWNRKSLGVLTTGYALLVATACVIIKTKGFEDQLPSDVQKYLNAAKDFPPQVLVTASDLRAERLVRFGTTEVQPTVAVWGDSHAMAIAPGLAEACKAQNASGLQFTYSLNAPLVEFVYRAPHGLNDEGPAFNELVIATLKKHGIKSVVLSAYWQVYALYPDFRSRLSRTLERLQEIGCKAYIVLDVPSHEYNIPHALAQRSFRGVSTKNIGCTKARYEFTNGPANRIIREVAEGRAIILDPKPYLGDEDGFWFGEFDGVPLYHDSNHLTLEGSRRLAPLFEALFK